MAIDNPTIQGYKPFYLYRSGTGATSGLKETKATWGFIAKVNPYPALPSPKEPYGVDYPDSNGKSESVTNMYYESQDVEVKFYIRTKDTVVNNVVTVTAAEEIRSQMASFFAFVKEKAFSFFDSYTAIGRQSARYAGFSEEEFKSRKGTAYCIFSVKFKVNDPCTFMKLDNSANPTSIIQV